MRAVAGPAGGCVGGGWVDWWVGGWVGRWMPVGVWMGGWVGEVGGCVGRWVRDIQRVHTDCRNRNSAEANVAHAVLVEDEVLQSSALASHNVACKK